MESSKKHPNFEALFLHLTLFGCMAGVLIDS